MQDDQQLLEFLHHLNHGRTDLQQLLPHGSFGPDLQTAVSDIDSFLERVRESLRVLDRAVGKMGVKEALNVLQIHRLRDTLESQNQEIGRLSGTVEELAQGISNVAEDAFQAAELTNRMSDVGTNSLELLRGVLTSVEGLAQQSTTAKASVETLVEQSRGASSGLKAIRSVAGTSQMLAINAAILSARTNDRAFAVVAQEMRSLADRTAQLIKNIETQVTAMEQAAKAAVDAMEAMSGASLKTGGEARQASANLGEIQSLIQNASLSVQNIAAVAQEQAAATESLASTAQDLTEHVAAASQSLNLTRDLGVSNALEEAQHALGLFVIGSRTDAIRAVLDQLAKHCETALEQAVADGRVRLVDLWDTDYREIKGADIGGLSRLFRVDKVPPTGFTPPKYRTSYDHQVDLPLVGLLDKCLDTRHMAFATILDLNAFAVAQPRVLAQDWTGVHEKDLMGNRAKRIFGDVYGRRAARVALPPSVLEKDRLTRADLTRHGIFGAPPPEVRPFLLQTYARDAGDVVLDMAMPIYVQGQRWGTARIGYFPEG